MAKPEPLNHPVMFSHGTLGCRDLDVSRKFYEEFLGLDCVRHTKEAMVVRKGGYFGVVCLQIGDMVQPMRLNNHWGLDLESKEAVDCALALAHEHQDRYGIRKIGRIDESHGAYSFYFQDLDGNFWEFQYVGLGQDSGDGRFDRYFQRGDIEVRQQENMA